MDQSTNGVVAFEQAEVPTHLNGIGDACLPPAVSIELRFEGEHAHRDGCMGAVVTKAQRPAFVRAHLHEVTCNGLSFHTLNGT